MESVHNEYALLRGRVLGRKRDERGGCRECAMLRARMNCWEEDEEERTIVNIVLEGRGGEGRMTGETI